MGFYFKQFSDLAETKEISPGKTSNYDNIDDSKMEAHEWFNSSRVMTSYQDNQPQVVVIYDDTGEAVFRWTTAQEGQKSTRKAVKDWRDQQKSN